jgi:hypothetical protein
MSWSDERACARSGVAPEPPDNVVWKSRVLIQIPRVWTAVGIILACLTGAQLAGGMGNWVALVMAEYRTKRDILCRLDLDGSRLRDTWGGRLLDVGSAVMFGLYDRWLWGGSGGCWTRGGVDIDEEGDYLSYAG